MLRPGAYEQLINRRLASELERLPERCRHTAAVDRQRPPVCYRSTWRVWSAKR